MAWRSSAALVALAESVMSPEDALTERTPWTRCFAEADIDNVVGAYAENAAAASGDGDDRCSCIVMLNVALGRLLPLQLKQNRARGSSDRRVQMADAYGMSVMDGYHSVLLLVDRRSEPGRIYWLDQFSGGLDDNVTDSLDQRVTTRTREWWRRVMDTKGKGYRTTLRLWPLQKPSTDARP